MSDPNNLFRPGPPNNGQQPGGFQAGPQQPTGSSDDGCWQGCLVGLLIFAVMFIVLAGVCFHALSSERH